MTKPNLLSLHLLLGILTFSLNGFSQSTINAASNSVIIDGHKYEYSIGEMTLVSTERNKNLVITQGYLQPQAGSSSNANFPSIGLSELTDKVKVYPNPTEDILFIETTDAIANQLNFQIIDALGKVVLRKEEKQVNGTNKFSIQLSSLAAGSYFLLIHKDTDQFNTLSYKIQKIQ